MNKFKEYILESQTISHKDVPKSVQTKEFKNMLSQSKANKDLVLVIHITDQGSEAELLNKNSSFEKQLLQHRLKGGAKIVEQTEVNKYKIEKTGNKFQLFLNGKLYRTAGTEADIKKELENLKRDFKNRTKEPFMKGSKSTLVKEDVREIRGPFDKINLSRIHRLKPFKVGDTLISRKGEKFTVTKIEPRKIFKDGKWFPEGESIDITGNNKGKIFTIIVR